MAHRPSFPSNFVGLSPSASELFAATDGPQPKSRISESECVSLVIAERLILTTFLLQPESVSNRVKFNDRLALTSVTVTLQGRVLLRLLLVSDMQYLYSQGKDSSILIRLMEDGPVHVLSYSKQLPAGV